MLAFLAVTGAGLLSLDALLSRRRQRLPVLTDLC
jgi:hypothetical protein